MNEVQPIRDKEKIEQMKRELAKNGARDEFLFTFGINTGFRISDIVKLKVGDVRGKSHLPLKETKTKKNRRFRLNYELQEEIEKYTEGMKDEDWLFKSKRNDKHIDRIQAHKIISKAAKNIGLKEISTHTMRKTFGYHFYKKTGDVAMLQDIFNHSAPSITKAYIGISQDEIDKVIDDFHL
ncbi:site-specific integrase [Lysinibacillus fusiformis]|uniref:site-specific integrase n=1 Tax=Lysinibacillus fusiformis TaxID=28031 RepID=UPI003CFCAEA5